MLIANDAESLRNRCGSNPLNPFVYRLRNIKNLLSHFGSWNFEKADIWHNVRPMKQDEAVDYMMKNFNYTKEKAETNCGICGKGDGSRSSTRYSVTVSQILMSQT